MPHTTEMIEQTLVVTTSDEGVAVLIAEMVARFMVGLSAEPDTSVTASVARYDVHCHGDPEELADEHEVGS